MQSVDKAASGVSRAKPLPYPAFFAWGIWFVASGVVYSKYLDREYAHLWPSVTFWFMSLMGPVAYYRNRDETFIAWAALVVLTVAMMLGG